MNLFQLKSDGDKQSDSFINIGVDIEDGESVQF
jgi:hypothetical protein